MDGGAHFGLFQYHFFCAVSSRWTVRVCGEQFGGVQQCAVCFEIIVLYREVVRVECSLFELTDGGHFGLLLMWEYECAVDSFGVGMTIGVCADVGREFCEVRWDQVWWCGAGDR